MPNELDQLADQGGPLTLPEPSDYDPFGRAAERTRKGVHSRARAEAAEGRNLLDPLFGTGGAERYQTWPERLVRSAATAPGDALARRLTDEETVMEPNALARLFGADPSSRWSVPSSGSMIGRAQDVAGAAITGPLTMRSGAATLGSGATRPAIGDAVMKPIEPAPVFYSAVEQAVKSAKQNTASPDQWMGYIRNQPGVKVEELQWMGLEDWLKEQKGPVSKKQVDDYVASHKVELKEIDKREGVGPDQERLEGMRREHEEAYGERLTDEELIEEYEALYGEKPAATKYGDPNLQLPGGENYRELLLTLPQKEQKQGLTPNDFSNGLFGGRKDVPYMSSHWDEPNVLAHVRVNDRDMPRGNANVTDAEARQAARDYATVATGDWDRLTTDQQAALTQRARERLEDERSPPAKTLFLEEVQSDWHQAGRKQGYKGKQPPDTSNWTAQFYPKGPKEGPGMLPEYAYWAVKDENGNAVGISPSATSAAEAIKETAGRGFKDSGVPDAPFKTTWPDLVLKRMIREAAEKGYDQIAWTPGEVQVARYDLSKHVKSVHYNEGTGDLQIFGLQGQNVLNKAGVKPEQLTDYVGKDVADKLMKQELETTSREVNGKAVLPGERSLSGLDLKIGGEGMKSFYDKMLVDKANALVKRHGGKVEKQKLGGAGDEYVPAPDGTWYLADAQGVRVDSAAPTYKTSMVKTGSGDTWYAIDENTKQSPGGSFSSKAEAEKWIEGQGKPQHVWVLPITPKLRDAAIGKGFPLFSSGVPFVPVDHDPFAQRKPRLEPVDHDPFAVLPYDPNRM